MRESSAAAVNLLVPTNNGIGPDGFPHDNSESASDSLLAESKNDLTGRERKREPRGRERVVFDRERKFCVFGQIHLKF